MADIKPILDGAQVPPTVKADAWDAFQQSGSQQDFQARFDKLALPKETKAALWDAKFGGGQVAAPTAAQPAASDQPGPVHRFLSGVYDSTIGPAVHMATHPMETVMNTVAPAINAIQHPGDTLKRYAVNAVTPQIPDEILKGDMPAAAGKAVGTALSVAAPELLNDTKIPIAPKITNPNPAEAAATSFLEKEGVPVSAAAKTGNAYVKNIQKAADSTPLGGIVAQRAQAATTKGLQATSERLASRAHPTAVAPEQAGTGVSGALDTKAAGLGSDADSAYGDFRLMEQHAPMPVDVSGIKAQLKPIYEDMQKWIEPAKRNASAGFQAIKSIIDGPDSIPASQAEAGLGGLKQLGREGIGRNSGLAKLVTPQLQRAIDGAVSAADPAALDALNAGRSATAAQYGVRGIADQLRAEPVQTFRQMTYAKDSGIDLLRQVGKEVPAELPKVGRAFLDDLFTKAQDAGGFGHADKLFSDWTNLGPETKKLLYPDALLRGDLDKFFLGAKKLAENPNPSGSGVITISGGTGALIVTHPATGVPLAIGAGALSKMMHSSTGVRLLTNGMKIPANKLAAISAAGQILKMAGGDVEPVSLPAAAENDQSARSGLTASAQGPK